MKIKKFKKDRGNTYKILFDNEEEITLYDDVIVKYNLLVSKELTDKLLDEIKNYNEFLNGYYSSIKYMNRKMRTELEIKNFLKKQDIVDKDIDIIINMLYKDGYLNKINYLCSFLNDQYNLTLNGPNKIIKNLNELGYENNEIIEYLYKYDWDSRIEKIVKKKIKLNHKLSINSLKQKILNDLINLGYDKDKINKELEKAQFLEEDDILKNELIKIKKKYSLKYSENDLKYKVVNFLYKKGFKIEDIKRCYDEN